MKSVLVDIDTQRIRCRHFGKSSRRPLSISTPLAERMVGGQIRLVQLPNVFKRRAARPLGLLGIAEDPKHDRQMG